jgi:hypothetical protein
MCRKAAGRRHPTLTLPDITDELETWKGKHEQTMVRALRSSLPVFFVSSAANISGSVRAGGVLPAASKSMDLS